ncbi:polymer-forming cytoskeletal protein [Vibrio metschnikovii]|uniref:Polymer-forming cytoskeletal protein n=1 Tax=Vibrio metschnikovii TaxID=28172 RepID=A0A9X0UH95_VIBME|nr:MULTISPECIES: polymer-forming cytoskeletal protein [Vibrio]MDQ2189324.1 polymer-forming cytoskeletal protein [Vibrio sp. A14(2019)]PXA73418.1 polymer-forming cytoskeletal family protein [Vibrio sp. 11986-1-5]EKO3564546.1 polymer-forming cytoskeletal protein [Vibrio metschnikovii]EKO3570770.1 polymer-forming cytoskeletal protein [Vibrio metschnikovii]EKO3577969.1 polymer-forming cytoskeletal protein [Vibrio metschnikovii]
MGIFSKQSRTQSQRAATTLIAKGCSISGQLRLEDNIQIDGLVDGQLHVIKTIVVSESGAVNGDIFAQHVIINGAFEGTCHADKIEILSKGVVNGTLYTDDLSIEQGGRFNGMTHPAAGENVTQLVDAVDAKETKNTKIHKEIKPATKGSSL